MLYTDSVVFLGFGTTQILLDQNISTSHLLHPESCSFQINNVPTRQSFLQNSETQFIYPKPSPLISVTTYILRETI